MSPKSGENSSQKTNTIEHRGRRTGLRRTIAAVGLVGVAAAGVFVASGKHNEGDTSHKANQESISATANTDARALATDILKIYDHSSPSSQHREPGGEGESHIQKVTTYVGPTEYDLQVQSFGEGEITDKNVQSVTITTFILDPATGEAAGSPTFDMNVTLTPSGITSIDASVPGERGMNSEHIEFHGDRAVNAEGAAVTQEQTVQLFQEAQARLAEVK